MSSEAAPIPTSTDPPIIIEEVEDFENGDSISSLHSSSSSSNLASTDELILSNRELNSLDSAVLPPSTITHSVLRLDLSQNNFNSTTSIQSLVTGLKTSFPALQSLILDKNNLRDTDLAVFSGNIFPLVHTLWLNNNQLSDLNSIIQLLSKVFPNLTFVSFLCNPLCPNIYFNDGQADAYQRYRNFVIANLKKLTILDSTNITAEERKTAEEKKQFVAKIAKPKAPDSPKSSSHTTATGTGATSAATTPVSPSAAAPNTSQPPRVAAFLAKGRPRYDGTNSEGNRFIVNEDL